MFSVPAYANTDDVLQATCGVNNGTGVVFDENETKFHVMTAGHMVVDDDGNIRKENFVRFFDGKKSHKIKAKVLWHIYDKDSVADLAVLSINKRDFGHYPLPIPIGLAPKHTRIRAGDIIVSAGRPGARWPNAFKSNIKSIGYKYFIVTPKILGGRSGSGVFNKEGTELIGIVIRTNGKSVPLWRIYELTGW